MLNKSQPYLCLLALIVFVSGAPDSGAMTMSATHRMGIDIKATGLFPRYPTDRDCSKLTSLYASRIDVDGSKRDRPHSGVDGGRLGESILAPGNGTIIAAWRANWGWGWEGALLIRHTREELGLMKGPKYYYSEFDHLKFDAVRVMEVGAKVERGEKLATVFRPGGISRYLPEVHWEVWDIDDDDATRWRTNRFNGRYWLNKTGHLIDPLYMLSLDGPLGEDGAVPVPIYDPSANYDDFRGFTYIFACQKFAKHEPAEK
jgi:murein DD-endopeptidase MepM/ murein hydrolase activator NlpD